MLSLNLEGPPVAQKRPRFRRQGSHVTTYDTQSRVKERTKLLMLSQLTHQRHINPILEPLSLRMRFYTPIPISWPKKARNAKQGTPDPRRPDIDNYVKFYCDVMNGLVYGDDAQVAEVICEKIHSDQPRTEIEIHRMGEDMIKEHAATVRTLEADITVADLEYMVKKANRLGKLNRNIVRVLKEEDGEGTHYYFECEAPRERGE